MSSSRPTKPFASKSKSVSATVDLTLSSGSDDDDGPSVVASSSKARPKTTISTPSKRTTGDAKATNSSSTKAKPVRTTSVAANGSPLKRKLAESSNKGGGDDRDDEDDDDVKPASKKRATNAASSRSTAARKKKTKVESDEDDYNDDGGADYKDEDEDMEEDDLDDGDFDEEDEEDVKPSKTKKKPASKTTAAADKKKAPSITPAKKAVKPSSATAAAAASAKASTSKTKVEAKEEAVEEEAKPKYKWQPKVREGPSNPGGKVIPDGAPDCLGGLTIVFTGELETIGREEAQTLAKRYGAKVTTSVSSKTSYVVLGADAGPKKLDMIKKNKIKTLDEDGFLNLIATRGAKDLDHKYLEKQKEEEKKIREAAKSIAVDPALAKSSLWTVKYAPQTVKELCGNNGMVEKLQAWLEAWPKSLASGFKKPGKDGWGTFRAVLISGPPGIGKTTAAHLVAKLAGYSIIEMNASDTRSKKLLEAQLRSSVDNTVLDGFLQGKKATHSLTDMSDRSVLIMDEVDGTSAGDRGGIGALNALIKKTKIPIICIANDVSLQKMKPLTATTFQLKFRRPDANMIRSRLMTIAFREGLKIDKTVADQLVSGTQSDIRQIINILSTWKLGHNTLNFDETKRLTESRDGNSLLTPFALMDKLFGPYSWSDRSGTAISQKLEVYFQEFDLLPLFVQENYLKHKYARAAGAGGARDIALKKAELTSRAADAISDGDMVDRMIHGTQQHWTLMPVHGMLSTVFPSYWTYGSGGYGGYGAGGAEGNARAFPGWFGKNSTQGRLQRALTDIQIRMRLKVSGDRREIRQSYIPALFYKLVTPLVEEGAEAIEEVIEQMDRYYLSKDEWDSLVELGIGENAGDPILKNIKTQTKTAFTRKYNTTDHPIPFHRGTEIPTSGRRGPAAGEQPDLEEAFEVEVEAEADEDDAPPRRGKKGGGEEDGVIKDKLVKAKKPAAAKKGGKAAASKVKAED